MTNLKIFGVFILLFLANLAQSQVVINEISNKNSGQIADEDMENEDWIELYNTSDASVNLSDYYLSDDSTDLRKWNFPSYQMQAGEHLVIFASDKNRHPIGAYHWESAVLPEHDFSFIIPTSSTPSNWKNTDFVPTGWNIGKAGFGYGDEDDATVVPSGTTVLYMLKSFTLPAGFNPKDIALHVDYDDGFVAWLNGKEIGRSNISGTPAYNSTASGNHEAVMYSGGTPEKITIDTSFIKSLLRVGKNVFAFEVHNLDNNSSDLSIIPFLSFLLGNSYALFDKSHSWLIPAELNSMHTNFKISSEGENIYLYNAKTISREDVWVDNLDYGWSMGRTTDGALSWAIFIEPTPSNANTTEAFSAEREPEPLFSAQEGYYSGTQSISLSSVSVTSEIRYTTDGNEPLSTSILYTGTPVSIGTSNVLRAKSYSKSGKLPSRSVSNTYFINNDGHSVPVLSVITSNSNLYGATGIFDHWDQEWDKPCYVEYFDANRNKVFEQFSGIKIDGGAGGSRSHPQHSFRLEFDHDNYGDGDVKYMMIKDRPDREDYKSIYIRNGSNQWLTFPFKDAMETKITNNTTNNYYSAYAPVVVYINGSYFGLYEMREKLNDQFFEENYKANVDSGFHLLSLSYYYNSVLRALNGSVDTFYSDHAKFLSLNQSDPDYLKNADKIIDLDYYTDYIIAQSWIADTDWPYNNIKIVKGDFTGYRWRFILQDLEWALNPNGWTSSGTDHVNYMLNYDINNLYLRFWRELIKNQEYKRKFLNRFADIMNSSYLPENTIEIAQNIFDSSYSEMRSEYVMWGGGESNANSRMNQYNTNMDIFISELSKRSTTVRSNIVSNFDLTRKYTIDLQVVPENSGQIKINTLTPEVYPWNGVYFAGIPIRIEAVSTGNFIFDEWEPNLYITDIKNPVIETDVRLSGYSFIAKFKKYLPVNAVTISEINYSSSDVFPTSDWVELYNYGQTEIDLTGWYLRDENPEHKWVLLGSYILKPDDRLVLASNINKFNSNYPEVQNVMGSFDFGLGSPTDSVLLFDKNNRLICGFQYSVFDPWPTGAYEQGLTLELKNPDIDLNFPSNWFAGCLGGSPGVAYSPCGTHLAHEDIEARLFNIYPNPAVDEINIFISEKLEQQEVICRIFDVMGKEVTNEIFRNYQKQISLSVLNLPEGIYVVQLTCGKERQNLKFVKRNN
jgi:hypothetical protein